MPKRITEELNELVRIVANSPAGLSPRAIQDNLDPHLPDRTLRSRLSKLKKEGRLISTGKGPSALYFAAAVQKGKDHTSSSPLESEVIIPLSSKSKGIRKVLQKSVGQRRPVGYDRSFLSDYRPNETFYLSADDRKLLADAGTILQHQQPAGTYLREIYNRLLIDLSWNSSRLEGNTYSLLETQRLLDLGESVEGKDAAEAQMILNHKAAIELLCEQASDIAFNRYTILNLHAVLSDNLLSDPQACGRLRAKGVGITGSVFHPLEVPQMIEECFDEMLSKASAIGDPFEQALFVMVHIPYLQPFEDVNKRVSRLAANISLARMNLCPLSFVDVPKEDYTNGILGVYELNAVEYLRDVFVWAYTRSCERYSAVTQSLGSPDPFRLKHRLLIKSIVCDVVKACMSKTNAVAFIKNAIPAALSMDHNKRLMEMIETELSSLHIGNIARYRLKPSEYEAWTKTWQ